MMIIGGIFNIFDIERFKVDSTLISRKLQTAVCKADVSKETFQSYHLKR